MAEDAVLGELFSAKIPCQQGKIQGISHPYATMLAAKPFQSVTLCEKRHFSDDSEQGSNRE